MATQEQITFEWKIPEIIWNENGVIQEVKWEYHGTKGTYTTKLFGRHFITGDHTKEGFISQPDVVKDDVIQWIENDFSRQIEFDDDIRAMIAGPDQTIEDIPDPEPRLVQMKREITGTITAQEEAPIRESRSLE